jgi:adapter protein MecA 1/2
MDIERIDENIIRIIITSDDLQGRNVDIEELNYDSPETQELFWDMMEQAEDEFGFCVADSQLIVEPIPNSDNGFIVTITKIEEDADFESIQKYIKNKYKKSDLKKKEHTKLLTDIFIFSFSTFDDLISASSRIKDSYVGDSSVYKFMDEYYLVLMGHTMSRAEIIKMNVKINEYGDRFINPTHFEGVLCEYGELLIKNIALEVLDTYFD